MQWTFCQLLVEHAPRLKVANPLDATMLPCWPCATCRRISGGPLPAMIRHYVLAEGGDPGAHIPMQARGILGDHIERVRAVRSSLRAGLERLILAAAMQSRGSGSEQGLLPTVGLFRPSVSRA